MTVLDFENLIFGSVSDSPRVMQRLLQWGFGFNNEIALLRSPGFYRMRIFLIFENFLPIISNT